MNLNDKIRQDAKLDSRRFGKSIVCRIVHGELLALVTSNNIGPRGVYFTENGLDPINRKMLVMPAIVYDRAIELIKNYQLTPSDSDTEIDKIEVIRSVNSSILTYIRQNIILVTISQPIQDGVNAGLDPNVYDVIIDSIDVNQAIEGTYVYKTVENVRERKMIT